MPSRLKPILYVCCTFLILLAGHLAFLRWLTHVDGNPDAIVEAMFEYRPSDRVIDAIEACGDVNAYSAPNRSSVLNAAVRAGRNDIALWLLERGANPNPPGQHPLYWALQGDDIRMARRLLEAGSKWSALTNDGETIEAWAAENRPKLLRELKGIR